MGAVKRKEAPGGDNPSKKAKASKDSRPTKREQPTKVKAEDRGDKKRAKTENDGDSKKKPGANAASAPAQPAVVSVLKEEEPMFPRGGGSVLTPLEQKQIQMEAKADALKEEEEFDTQDKTKSKKERKKKSKFDAVANNSKDEDAVKIDSLNFKVGRPLTRTNSPSQCIDNGQSASCQALLSSDKLAKSDTRA